jgi:hypothetical protein
MQPPHEHPVNDASFPVTANTADVVFYSQANAVETQRCIRA